MSDEDAESGGNGAEPPAGESAEPAPGAGKPPEEVTPFDRVTNHWEVVIEDMYATAEEFREQGWTALECHPGDVHPVDDEEQLGLDVVISGEEYEAILKAVEAEGAAFDSVEVFRAEAEGLVFAVVVVSDEPQETAVLVPVYYDVQKAKEMLSRATVEGQLSLYVRDLQTEDIVTFEMDDPMLFVPQGTLDEE